MRIVIVAFEFLEISKICRREIHFFRVLKVVNETVLFVKIVDCHNSMKLGIGRAIDWILAEINTMNFHISVGKNTVTDLIGQNKVIIFHKTLQRFFKTKPNLHLSASINSIDSIFSPYFYIQISRFTSLKINSDSSDKIFIGIIRFQIDFNLMFHSDVVSRSYIFCVFVAVIFFWLASSNKVHQFVQFYNSINTHHRVISKR